MDVRSRFLLTLTIAALVATLGAKAPLSGQTAASSTAAAGSKTAARSIPAVPRTPDGHPDLQGVWTHGTATPFERPPALGTKAFYTEAEAADLDRQLAERRRNPTRNTRPGDVGSDNEAFVDSDSTYLSTRQTSLVVDPPDGRLPFRPEAERQREFNLANTADFETMSPWDRCITRSATMLLPAGYNNGIQIVQTNRAVVLLAEMIHEARIVPTDGSPHPPAAAASWTGDSRGRWDGDTLVIDTTNFAAKGWLSTHAGSGRLRGAPQTAALHLVERLSPLDARTIRYEMTVTDPNVFTRPWTVSLLLHRSDDYQIYEYACHEGNTAIELALRGARADEVRAAAR
jgi:hypothetical protein